MESALYGVYTLVVLYQKSHSFASLTCSISDTPQLVCKHRTRALSMKYSIRAWYNRTASRGLIGWPWRETLTGNTGLFTETQELLIKIVYSDKI